MTESIIMNDLLTSIVLYVSELDGFKKYLLSHEDDIHNEINDFGELSAIFATVIERTTENRD